MVQKPRNRIQILGLLPPSGGILASCFNSLSLCFLAGGGRTMFVCTEWAAAQNMTVTRGISILGYPGTDAQSIKSVSLR